MGVCTCTTPAASFSINIPGPTLKPEIGQSNYWAAIIAGARCNGKPFFQRITEYFNGTSARFPLASSGLEYFARKCVLKRALAWPAVAPIDEVKQRLRGGCPCGGSGPPPQIRVRLLPPEL